MKHTSFQYWLPTALIILAGCTGGGLQASLQTVDVTIHAPLSATGSSSVSKESSSSIPPAAKSLRIAVPFSPQAPFANWDPLHEEACEEMSLIMVTRYWQNEPLTRQQAEESLQALIAWETDHGYKEDTTAEETAQIVRDYFGMAATVRTDVTAETIKEELRNGRPVIIPAAGRDLGNPFFSGEGPWFHMLVIIGYTEDGAFITHDPGTKRGENYLYDEETLLSAIHDWTGAKESIREGRKAMVVIGS
ncbi:MAG: C39 family peptidase [Candidatus Peribacteraceae bacterium]|jgi:uncharacterized protein YeaC (DUF1315 family)